MKNLNDNTQMGSALTTVFNRRETFLNGGNAAVKQTYETTSSDNAEVAALPECLETLSLQKIFKDGHLSDEELEKMIKYQQAYNAASRFVNVVNQMLEHLVTSLGNA